MPYDEGLAERVREQLAPQAPFEERKMFGGLAFMVNTHMACGIVKDDLMVRVGKAGHDAALAAGAGEMSFTGRPMRACDRAHYLPKLHLNPWYASLSSCTIRTTQGEQECLTGSEPTGEPSTHLPSAAPGPH